MALILRGKNKGKSVTVKQWANNWVSIEGKDIEPQDSIMNPTSLEYMTYEIEVFNRNRKPNIGIFWGLFEWHPKKQGRLIRKKLIS